MSFDLYAKYGNNRSLSLVSPKKPYYQWRLRVPSGHVVQLVILTLHGATPGSCTAHKLSAYDFLLPLQNKIIARYGPFQAFPLARFPSSNPGCVCSVPQVVRPACFRFVPCHEAHLLWECHVGHLLLQQAEGWSHLQSLFPGCPQSRSEQESHHINTNLNIYIHVLTLPSSSSSSSPAGCGGSISSWNGSIFSPHYPSFYPPNVDCVWTVKVSHVTGHGHADIFIACSPSSPSIV